MKGRLIVSVVLFQFLWHIGFANLNDYNSYCQLSGIKDKWHKFILPQSCYKDVKANLSDIRVYGITSNNDTIQAAYYINSLYQKSKSDYINFKLLNNSYNQKGHFYTFQVDGKSEINSIDLKFNQQNFDWKVKLEGSHNQQQWFNIVDNYRLVAFKHKDVKFSYATVDFKNSNFKYYRLLVKTNENPGFKQAKVLNNKIDKAVRINVPSKAIGYKHDKKNRTSTIEVSFEEATAVSNCLIEVKEKFNYFRPIIIQAVIDSFNTEKGWKYQYRTLCNETLISGKRNEFNFVQVVTNRLKITVINNDNQALEFNSIYTANIQQEMIVRFVEKADYYFAYGNEKANFPKYDIHNFKEKHPTDLETLSIGNCYENIREVVEEKGEFQTSKTWLWLVMLALIALMAYFSFVMLNSKAKSN